MVGGRAANGGFQIMVRDNGPGIPRDKLDKIFKPFNQVDNRYDRQAGGTGLGLALVRGLAELHGGRAWLESEYGKGCARIRAACRRRQPARRRGRQRAASVQRKGRELAPRPFCILRSDLSDQTE